MLTLDSALLTLLESVVPVGSKADQTAALLTLLHCGSQILTPFCYGAGLTNILFAYGGHSISM